MMNDTPAYVPWNASAEGFLYANIFDGLLYSHLGAVDDIRGNIAETWEHSDDYRTWTFKIREGVKFTDGTVCDAPAMEKCWNYHYEMSPTSITNYNIATWEATGDLEFVVTLSAPCAYFENALAGNSLVAISPTACETYGTDNNGCAVGTAPYYVEEYVSGVGMTLKANPNYHPEEKRPHIETINFVVIKDNNTLMMALLNGEWTVTVGSNGYTNATPYTPWTFILTPDAMIKQIWCDVYDPDLYNTMLYEYAAIISSSTWEEMLNHCRQLTTYAQDDHAAVLGIQRPGFVILNAEYKNAIYYTNSQYIMLYYLYVY